MPKVTIDLPYEVLEKIVKAYPGILMEDAVRRFIIDSLGGEIPIPQSQSDISKVQRFLQDMVNPFTAKIDEVARRLSNVFEVLDELSEKVKNLEEDVKSIKGKPEPQLPPQQPREVKKSAIDVLKDQRVMYERDIASKIRNRDAFFDRLRRDGALVFEVKGQRVAIEPSYWSEFRSQLESLTTSNESELRDKLGKVGYNLLKTLWEGGLIYYDSISKKWKFTEEVS
ncbi:MAG: hypothetical protein RMH77_03575 [Sulfolobales archaeon]|nr:hypothetical protein [Sulfolobales archaeon]MCX8186177.1 hypothetical protein [Sulfolobales archaeon]MDW7969472.1 hypothetical protein [Sulfolobales archaeon]